jgi:hypothetical protein
MTPFLKKQIKLAGFASRLQKWRLFGICSIKRCFLSFTDFELFEVWFCVDSKNAIKMFLNRKSLMFEVRPRDLDFIP